MIPSWASDRLAPDKFDRNAVELPRYADIESAFGSDAQFMVAEFQRGGLNRNELISNFDKRLRDAEMEAFVAGRRARGIARNDVTDDDGMILNARHQRQMAFFRRFVDDMEAGRGRMGYLDRARLYSKSLWSIYTRGESVAFERDPRSARYYWIMDVDAEHCQSCIQRAKMSRDRDGFEYDELVELGWPGENTDCMVNCRCHIRQVRKRSTPLPADLQQLRHSEPKEGLQQLAKYLGGDSMPIPAPAAGIAGVKIDRPVLLDAVRVAGDPLRAALPMLPLLLTKPLDMMVLPTGDRVYTGYGLDALVSPDENGLARLSKLILSGEDWRG